MYGLRILDQASRDLAKLDRAVGTRVVKRLQWLSQNLGPVKPQPLTENLAGFYKLRVGDYRVIYEILEEEKILLIHAVGHRREIYKK